MNRLLKVATFNCEWRASGSADAGTIRERLLALEPDIICLTEAYRDFFGGDGHVIEADPDYGYPAAEGRRKVLLWSRHAWREADSFGHGRMPTGRLIAGITATPIGDVHAIGVCIPWAGAHVRSGRWDRAPWDDHLAYLEGMAAWLTVDQKRTVLLGDFNQRVPRRYQPQHVLDALCRAILNRLQTATVGEIPAIGRLSIDHICHSADLTTVSVAGISNIGPDQRQLSDHFGVGASFAAT